VDVGRSLLALAATQHGLLMRSGVSRLGVTPGQWQRRVGRGDWVKVSVGVWRHVLVPDSWQLRARAGLLYLGDDAALFGATAAAWWGVDIPRPAVVEFVAPRSRRRLENDLVVHTREDWDPGDFLRHDGARLTSVTRTAIDLAGIGATAQTIENVIDDGIRSRRTSLPTLRRRIDELSGPGHHGIPLLRALLLDSGGESYLERKFLVLMRQSGLPRPLCQVVHRGGTDGRIKRVDFQFPGTNIVVEVSGRLGHVSDRERQKDARRRNSLLHSGFPVVEFTTADVLGDAPYVVATVRTSLASASQHV
jgi:hypothetical protein